jgi:hypothetical protein
MTDRIGVTKSSPSTSFYLEADVVSQNQAGNYSTVRCYLRAVNAGNTSSYYGGSGVQAGSIDGIGEFGRHSASPFLPSGYANGAWRWRDGYWDVNISHNADGTRGPITLRMSLIYGSINESHTASLSFSRIPKVPAAPTNVSPTPDEITSSSMRYRFSGGDNGGSAIIEWQIQYAKSADFTVEPLTVSSSGTSTLTSLAPGTQYWMRARGRNAIGWGSYSSAATGTTLGAPPQPPTDILLVTTPPDQINIDWVDPVNTGGKPITGYDIQLAENSSFTAGLLQQSAPAGSSEFDWTGLAPAKTYWMRVRANNVDATGEWSSPASAMIPAGGKAWTGTGWKAAVWRAWTGTGWKAGLVKVWDGTQWVLSK